MGLLTKIANTLTGNKIKIRIEIVVPFNRQDAVVAGNMYLYSGKAQTLQEIHLKVREFFESGRGKNKNSLEMIVGEAVFGQGMKLEAKTETLVPFSLELTLQGSKYDKMKDKGGFSALKGSIGKLMAAERTAYTLAVEVTPEGKAEPKEAIVVLETD